MANVRLHESQDALWRRFHRHTTEMVVTKNGRKMFPRLEYVLEGLNPESCYALVLQVHQVDEHRYKFSGGQWMASGLSEPRFEAKRVIHADGAMSGRQWMANPVNFDRVKITNNPHDSCQSHIFLQSMHKYIPVLEVFELAATSMPFMTPSQTSVPVVTIRLPYTEFIAVTAYQNQSITNLKIENNPYAKGFREGSDRKRPSPSSSDDQRSSRASSSPSSLHSPLPAKRLPPADFVASPAIFAPFAMNPILYSSYLNPYFFGGSPLPFMSMSNYALGTPPPSKPE